MANNVRYHQAASDCVDGKAGANNGRLRVIVFVTGPCKKGGACVKEVACRQTDVGRARNVNVDLADSGANPCTVD
jgi:hypothetical protein